MYYNAAVKRSHEHTYVYTHTHTFDIQNHTSSNQLQLKTTTYIPIYQKHLSHGTLIVLMYGSDHTSRARAWLANHYVALSHNKLPKHDILGLLWLCKIETM